MSGSLLGAWQAVIQLLFIVHRHTPLSHFIDEETEHRGVKKTV